MPVVRPHPFGLRGPTGYNVVTGDRTRHRVLLFDNLSLGSQRDRDGTIRSDEQSFIMTSRLWREVFVFLEVHCACH